MTRILTLRYHVRETVKQSEYFDTFCNCKVYYVVMYIIQTIVLIPTQHFNIKLALVFHVLLYSQGYKNCSVFNI